MPKVSVILPVYNVGPYLDEALNSLTSQTLKDIEIIAVNDGSTDNSEEIIEKYMANDPRIQYHYQKNQGLSGARNTGMKFCKGEYVFFMDSDDIIEPDTLETCYNTARTNNADVCIFDAESFYEEGANKIPWSYDRSSFLSENQRYNGTELFSLLLDAEMHRAVVWLQFIKWSYLQQLQLHFIMASFTKMSYSPLNFFYKQKIFIIFAVNS